MKCVGIVGADGTKFTRLGEQRARKLIRRLLHKRTTILVSGACPLGGIDIWAEEEANILRRAKIIFPPRELNWAQGYKPRDLLIAKQSAVVHNIVVDRLPKNFQGMRHRLCYHCGTDEHVKSGGCWTAKRAIEFGNKAVWHTIHNFK